MSSSIFTISNIMFTSLSEQGDDIVQFKLNDSMTGDNVRITIEKEGQVSMVFPHSMEIEGILRLILDRKEDIDVKCQVSRNRKHKYSSKGVNPKVKHEGVVLREILAEYSAEQLKEIRQLIVPLYNSQISWKENISSEGEETITTSLNFDEDYEEAASSVVEGFGAIDTNIQLYSYMMPLIDYFVPMYAIGEEDWLKTENLVNRYKMALIEISSLLSASWHHLTEYQQGDQIDSRFESNTIFVGPMKSYLQKKLYEIKAEDTGEDSLPIDPELSVSSDIKHTAGTVGLDEELISDIENAAESLLKSANDSGKVDVGRRAAIQNINNNSAEAVFISRDAKEVSRVIEIAERAQVPILSLEGARIDQALNRQDSSVATIREPGIDDEIFRDKLTRISPLIVNTTTENLRIER